jgi:hypothetical protein
MRKQVASKPGKSRSEVLDFERMDEMIDAYAAATKGSLPGRAERYAFVIGVVGTVLALVTSVLSSQYLSVWWAVGGVAVELAGFTVFLALFLKREWRSFRNSRRDYAIELDRDFGKYMGYVRKLRNYPRNQRDRLLRYIHARRKVMHSRMGLVTGGMERLGVIPLLAALYLQFKDWRLGDWAALGKVTFIQGFLAVSLLVIYVASWGLILLYSRTEAYELLLIEAAEQEDEVGRESMST